MHGEDRGLESRSQVWFVHKKRSWGPDLGFLKSGINQDLDFYNPKKYIVSLRFIIIYNNFNFFRCVFITSLLICSANGADIHLIHFTPLISCHVYTTWLQYIRLMTRIKITHIATNFTVERSLVLEPFVGLQLGMEEWRHFNFETVIT